MRHVRRAVGRSAVLVLLAAVAACAGTRQSYQVATCDLRVANDAADAAAVSRQMVRDLFRAGGHACASDRTFMLAYNAAVYNTLEMAPEMFLREFGDATNQQFVLTQLQRPLSPDADPERVLRAVSIAGLTYSRDYGKVVRALRLAHEKTLSSR
jgi:hypothetical protein